jgi:hypothetical protein
MFPVRYRLDFYVLLYLEAIQSLKNYATTGLFHILYISLFYHFSIILLLRRIF